MYQRPRINVKVEPQLNAWFIGNVLPLLLLEIILNCLIAYV